MEQSPTSPDIENHPKYKHLILLDIEDAAYEVLEIVIKRHVMFCRTLSDEKKLSLEQILTKNTEPGTNSKTELASKLKPILNKEQIAAYQHIKNSYSSIRLAFDIQQHFEATKGIDVGIQMGIKILCTGLHELYSGDQRFFKEHIKTRSEIGKEGGIARQKRHLATKQKACELLNTLTPQEGWTQEIGAYKAILPEVKKYMEENDIRNPTQGAIENTLRRWIKSDPLVSAAVRIIQRPAHNSTD